MNQTQIEKILAQLADHETRINNLENPKEILTPKINPGSEKQKTIREIIKGKKFKNGQEQVALIVD